MSPPSRTPLVLCSLPPLMFVTLLWVTVTRMWVSLLGCCCLLVQASSINNFTLLLFSLQIGNLAFLFPSHSILLFFSSLSQISVFAFLFSTLAKSVLSLLNLNSALKLLLFHSHTNHSSLDIISQVIYLLVMSSVLSVVLTPHPFAIDICRVINCLHRFGNINAWPNASATASAVTFITHLDLKQV